LLTDTKLKNLKGAERLYKVVDRDGLYVAVTPKGLVSFRLDYRLNGRRETLTIGRYGPTGMTLAQAREACLQAKKAITEGKSPARAKQLEKGKVREAKTFREYALAWLSEAEMADSTREARTSVLKTHILPLFGNRLLTEISPAELRTACEAVRDRGTPAAALFLRAVVHHVYEYAYAKGQDVMSPAIRVKASLIATIKSKERSLSPQEIRAFSEAVPQSGAHPQVKLGMEVLLLTMVRKRELLLAKWAEIDFERAVWTIPTDRMKRRLSHNVYLSDQAVDLLKRLKELSGDSEHVLPPVSPRSKMKDGRTKPKEERSKTMGIRTLNAYINRTVTHMSKAGAAIPEFTPHDLRRTASTALNEAGFNPDWVEKCLAHERQNTRKVYNKAEYVAGRRHMMQEWANMLDAWKVGGAYRPRLLPPELMVA